GGGGRRKHPGGGVAAAPPGGGPRPSPPPAAKPATTCLHGIPMTQPLRVAWLGHRSTTGADGIITYSREITAGLRDRGVEVVFFHHARDQADDEQSIALDAFSVSHRFVLSPPGGKRKLLNLLRTH